MSGPSVFISYAHKDNESPDPDKRWLDRLLEFLKPLQMHNQISIWSDLDIETGTGWPEQIQTSLADARAAVLLVSPSFIASDFIRNNELPVLLELAKERGVVIIPLILRKSLFQEITFKYPDPIHGPDELLLSSLQAANSPTRPLNALSESDQDHVLLSVAQRLLQIVQPVPFDRTEQRDSSSASSTDDSEYVTNRAALRRLANEIADRREFGRRFNILLGSACFLASGSDSSKEILKAIVGVDDYVLFCQALEALSEDEKNTRLKRHLLHAEIPSGYLALARLIGAGWFKDILTTNVDTFLERALSQVDLRGRTVRTLLVGDLPPGNILTSLAEPSSQITLVKLSGDLSLNRQERPGSGFLEQNGSLDKLLEAFLRRDTLVVGHGFGDPNLARYIKRRGDGIWLVNPEVNLNPDMEMLLRQRRSEDNIVKGKVGGFALFFEELEEALSDTPLSKPEDENEGILTLRRSKISAENAADLAREDNLVRLQQDLERVFQVVDNLKAMDPNRELTEYQNSYERLRQEIDALSHAGEGTILGGFKIGERLGKGGVGHVYRAVHIISGLEAAVKVMARGHSLDPTWRSRFFRGAKIMATLNHPNIARILDVGGIVGPWCYYAMELIDGKNLEVLLEAGTLEAEQKWAIARSILEAMAYSHRNNEKSPIVHRDLKPTNVLISANGTPKITDFDMAFLEDPAVLTQTSIAFGQAFYLAPELEIAPTILAQRDPRIDVFALGRILFRLLADISPVERVADNYVNNPDIFRFALSRNVPGAGVSALSSLLQNATSFDPASRFRDAYEMLEAFDRVELVAKFSPIDFSKRLRIRFAEIPQGVFLMGSPDDETEREGTEKLHKVQITSDFQLSETTITQGIWRAVWGEAAPATEEENIPIEKVSWYDAIGFCNALSVSFGLSMCYSLEDEGVLWHKEADGFRLPTEAEWEYACRAGSTTKYDLGDSEESLSRAAWYNSNCTSGPMPVAQKQANAWGLYDMLGNVWEWCWDWYAEYSDQDAVDPAGPDRGVSRVLRGGSWRRSPHHCRAALRYESGVNNRGRSLGFRIARTGKGI